MIPRFSYSGSWHSSPLRTRPPAGEEGEEIGCADVAVEVEVRRLGGRWPRRQAAQATCDACYWRLCNIPNAYWLRQSILKRGLELSCFCHHPRASNKPLGPISTRAGLPWGQDLTGVRYSSSSFDVAFSSTISALSLANCCSMAASSARSLASRLSPSAAFVIVSWLYKLASARL